MRAKRYLYMVGQRFSQILFQILIVITLFSIWAFFALLVVNKWFYEDLPGYTIGSLCIWELVALILAILIMRLMINKWGNLKIEKVGSRMRLTLDPKYGIYFGIYFLIVIFIGLWQFWLFSQTF